MTDPQKILKRKVPIKTFEDWIKTPTGKKCIEANLSLKEDEKFLPNRLWWAFQAGQTAWDIQYNSQVGEILREIARDYAMKLPKRILQKIEYIIKENDKLK